MKKPNLKTIGIALIFVFLAVTIALFYFISPAKGDGPAFTTTTKLQIACSSNGRYCWMIARGLEGQSVLTVSVWEFDEATKTISLADTLKVK